MPLDQFEILRKGNGGMTAQYLVVRSRRRDVGAHAGMHVQLGRHRAHEHEGCAQTQPRFAFDIRLDEGGVATPAQAAGADRDGTAQRADECDQRRSQRRQVGVRRHGGVQGQRCG